MDLLDKVIHLIVALVLGSFGALVRLIHSKPVVMNFLIIFSELIVGAFTGWLTYALLIQLTNMSFSIISIYCAVAGVMSREIVSLLIFSIKREVKEKYNINLRK